MVELSVGDSLSRRSLSRRSLLRSGLVGVGGLAAAGLLDACESSASTAAAVTSQPPTTLTVNNGDEALQRLLAGNGRFVGGVAVNQGRKTVRLAAVAEGQSPFAVVLGCSDSRVPPEIVFDEGIGDLFLVRVAGNTANAPALLGSIEYSVEHLGSVLVMVLGHENCGAVKAAVDQVRTETPPPPHVDAFVEPIVPAAEAVASQPPDQVVNAAIEENVRRQVQTLSTSTPVLGHLASEGKLKVVGATYRLETGRVELVS